MVNGKRVTIKEFGSLDEADAYCEAMGDQLLEPQIKMIQSGSPREYVQDGL